jgi:hypothetical protein
MVRYYDREWGGPVRHGRRLLREYCLRPASTERPFRSWNSLPDRALLAIKWHREKGRPCWHWVVFVRDSEGERVLDSKRSLKRHVRTDFGRMKPKWYIEVIKKAIKADSVAGPSRLTDCWPSSFGRNSDERCGVSRAADKYQASRKHLTRQTQTSESHHASIGRCEGHS